MWKAFLPGTFFLLWCLAVPSLSAAESTVLVVPKEESHPHWEEVRRGAVKAGAERGVRVIFRGPLSRDEPAAQEAIIEDGLADKVDAIVIAPSHVSRLSGSLNRARAAGVVVVIIDSPLLRAGYSSFIATDNHAAGWEAAEHLIGLVKPGESILLLRHVEGNESTEERERGFMEGVKSGGRRNRLMVGPYVGVSYGNAYHRIRTLLTDHPEVRGVFASSPTNTIACIQALKELGWAGKVRVIGFDLEPEIVGALRDKTLDGVMLQQPYRMGYLGVTTACDVLDGRKIPKRIVTKARLITDADDLGPVDE